MFDQDQGSLLELPGVVAPAPGTLAGIRRTELTVSLGCAGTLALRPRPGGAGGAAARRLQLGHGDLFVRGGSFPRTWQHAVPKTTKPVGPRTSVQLRTWVIPR